MLQYEGLLNFEKHEKREIKAFSQQKIDRKGGQNLGINQPIR